jgi:uncharacterized membrane protein
MDEPRDLTPLAVFLTCAALTWVAIVVVTPAAAARGRLPWLSFAAYEIGARICHQRPERSFHIAGIQMPVCARCFGLYAASAAGLASAWFLKRRRTSSNTMRLALLLAAAPIALTVALEWMGIIQTSNVVRMLTGLPPGAVAGFVVVGSLRRAGAGAPGAQG